MKKQAVAALHSSSVSDLLVQARDLAEKLSLAKFEKRKKKAQGQVVTTARLSDDLAKVLTIVAQKKKSGEA